jgi:hypothetical protein
MTADAEATGGPAAVVEQHAGGPQPGHAAVVPQREQVTSARETRTIRRGVLRHRLSAGRRERLQATPLQLAKAYATIVNGGRIVQAGHEGRGRFWRRIVEELPTATPERVHRSNAAASALILNERFDVHDDRFHFGGDQSDGAINASEKSRNHARGAVPVVRGRRRRRLPSHFVRRVAQRMCVGP